MGNLTLREYYICYMDVLGYQEKLKDYGADEFLQIMDKAFQDALINANAVASVGNIAYEYRLFSDNLLFCVEAKLDNAFRNVQFIAEMVQDGLLNLNIFLRGAITRGTMYFSENYVFGDGLIKAYQLENHIAIYPRVIVDKEIQDEIPPHFDYDTDGYFYADYLEAFSTGLDDPEYDPVLEKERITTHREKVVANLRSAKSDRIRQKYQWCMQYHNRACKAYGFDSLLITDDDLATDPLPAI